MIATDVVAKDDVALEESGDEAVFLLSGGSLAAILCPPLFII